MRYCRADDYGEVFLACRPTIISKEITLSTSCKIVAYQVFLDYQSVILCIDHLIIFNCFCSTISSIITSNSNDIVWLVGDLDLPNIDWNRNCISGNNYPTQLHGTLIDTMLDHNLSQLVDFPSRYHNTVRRKFLTGENIDEFDEFPAIRQYFPYRNFPFS